MSIFNLCLGFQNINVPKKHWANGANCEMTKNINHEMRKLTKVTIQNAKIVFLTCNKVTFGRWLGL
jgi:hypothetical protein